MQDKIKSLIETTFGLDTSGLSGGSSLFSDGPLDSLNSLKLLMVLEEEFGISISPLDVALEDVDSLDAIAATVARLKG